MSIFIDQSLLLSEWIQTFSSRISLQELMKCSIPVELRSVKYLYCTDPNKRHLYLSGLCIIHVVNCLAVIIHTRAYVLFAGNSAALCLQH